MPRVSIHLNPHLEGEWDILISDNEAGSYVLSIDKAIEVSKQIKSLYESLEEKKNE